MMIRPMIKSALIPPDVSGVARGWINVQRKVACVWLWLSAAALTMLLGATLARAEEPPPVAANGEPQPSIASSFPQPLRGLWGFRPLLADKGITFQVNYIVDPFINISGGLKRGVSVAGRVDAAVEVDLDTAMGWKGGTFHVGSYFTHGNGPSRHFVGNQLTVTDVESLATRRLNEIWLEQKFADDRASLRIGQVAADVEFFTSPSLNLIIGGTFGWPAIFGANIPSGGPAFPFAALGARFKYEPTDNLAFLAAVFDGDPAGPGAGDPQTRNRYGTNFRLKDSPFAIAEMQFKYGRNAQGQGLGGTIKIGGWQHFGRFADQRFGLDGLAVSDPSGIGQPLQKRGNYGLYGLIDQQIFRKGAEPGPGIYAFTRISASPSDRNPIDFYVDAGLNFQGMIDARPDDAFGFAAAFAKTSRSLRAADLDTNYFNAGFAPVRDYEALLQATYNIQIAPGLNIQPNIQYVIHPGGHIADPNDPLGVRALRNALVVGLRTNIKY